MKHLQGKFAGRYNIGALDAIKRMEHIVAGIVGRPVTYRGLIEPDPYSFRMDAPSAYVGANIALGMPTPDTWLHTIDDLRISRSWDRSRSTLQ